MEAPFLNLQKIFYEIYTFATGAKEVNGFLSRFEVFLNYLAPFSIIASLFLLMGIIYTQIRIKQIKEEEKDKLQEKYKKATEAKEASNFIKPIDERWAYIKEFTKSENTNDWKQAILNADIMLFEMLSKMEYPGESLGEMLKGVDKSRFKSLNSAWEAHKERNKIAHEKNFSLTNRRTKEIINLYKEVFQEFNYISE